MDQVKFVEGSLQKICLDRPYHFNLFKDCLPQILLGPFLSNLIKINIYVIDLKFAFEILKFV